MPSVVGLVIVCQLSLVASGYSFLAARVDSHHGLQDAAGLRARGFDLAYNLDHEQSLDQFKAAIAADPGDSASHRAAAAVTWLNIATIQRGAVTVEDFLGSVTRPSIPVEPAPARDALFFRQHIDRALSIAEARVRADPRDPVGQYELGATVGVLTSYQALVEGKALAAFRTARRAYQAHEEVLRLDPRRQDAGLIVGSYRYVVANLSLPMRMMAYVAGFGGGREKGLRLIEEAAAHRSDAQAEAQFLLVLIYNRERRYSDALRLIADLQRRYPRNRFLWLNGAGTALRAGRAQDAGRFIDEGLGRLATDRRPRAVGEEALWRYMQGAVHVALGRTGPAAEALRQALSIGPRAWVRGRIHLELGKLADLAGDRKKARAEYDQAKRVCGQANDQLGVDEAERWTRLPYAIPVR